MNDRAGTAGQGLHRMRGRLGGRPARAGAEAAR